MRLTKPLPIWQMAYRPAMPPSDGEYHDQHFKTGLKAPNREQLPLRTSSDYPIPRRLS
ncbi:hypothetical protein CKAH01_13015 [Colletotrichum kahawae]|uniref:Uncharacterized protein n=1 Tax=Colletotrichum kahawae TaxID=34407 RepID=A0AAD9YP99_COLKA|nr:hypothetical protein CKAH01_13015 [Colletotrichum kahawae]